MIEGVLCAGWRRVSGSGDDHLTNLVMFSKDKFRLDIIGLYLGGHEPGNINLYRIAKERGLSDTFNPWDIPIFEWTNGQAVRRRLTDFERTPLKTYYLQKDGETPLPRGRRSVRLRPLPAVDPLSERREKIPPSLSEAGELQHEADGSPLNVCC